MSKEVKEDDEESSRTKSNWSYDGNEDDWNTFDRGMQRFMRKKLWVFGENIWMGNIPDLNGMTPYEFDRYCMEVWKAIDCEDPSAARKLWDPMVTLAGYCVCSTTVPCSTRFFFCAKWTDERDWITIEGRSSPRWKAEDVSIQPMRQRPRKNGWKGFIRSF